jgi:hypothetical protein
MAPTTQSPKGKAQPYLQYLFVCHVKACKHPPTTEPREARQHWATEGHPYKSYPLPSNVHLDGHCPEPVRVAAEPEPASETMPEAPPPETLEQKLGLLRGLLANVAQLADELADDADSDPRFGQDSDVPEWLQGVSLQAEEDRRDVHLLLEELGKPAAVAASPAVARG